jgi:RNA polymerase sigma factor (sigma-70 family)
VKSTGRALEQQFERILREYGAAISRLAYSYEAIAGIREELVQEIAFAIWRALPHFRGACSEKTFVFRIAHNRGLTHVWKRRPPHLSLDDLEEAKQPIDPRPHPDEQLAQVSLREQLMSAVQSLPVAQRQIVVMLLEGLSYAEIGEVLGITENNVAVRLTRARNALKGAMGVTL